MTDRSCRVSRKGKFEGWGNPDLYIWSALGTNSAPYETSHPTTLASQIGVHASGAGSSIVCSQEGLMISSVIESPAVNCCSPSLLSPPYWTGTSSSDMYLKLRRIRLERWRISIEEVGVEVWFVDNLLEEGFGGFWRTGEDELAFGPLGEEWIDHLVESKVPPWNIDEHLQKKKPDQKKITNKCNFHPNPSFVSPFLFGSAPGSEFAPQFQ